MDKPCIMRATRSGWPFTALAAVLAAECMPVAAHAMPSGQGHRITKTWSVSRKGADLQISYGSGRDFPQYAAAGSVSLDNQPGQAFKPVMLSSMHISSAKWDAQIAFTGTRAHQFPPSGRIIHPPMTTKDFGLQGGTSAWKKNAPTIEVTLARNRQVTGWLTTSQNPKDDNVGFWCATDKVLSSWSFSATAEPGQNR